MKKQLVLIVFLIVQFVGLACMGVWEHVPSSLGMVMWGTALIVMFPGNFLGGWLIESLFWQGHLSLVGIGLLSAATAVLINGIIWFFVVKVFRLIFGRRSAARSSRTTVA
jgi:asparagine N-glycosylation enzyme membrane subunit Stt3